ncbi:hypothetical protein D3C87_1612090 [compost metagenome]
MSSGLLGIAGVFSTSAYSPEKATAANTDSGVFSRSPYSPEKATSASSASVAYLLSAAPTVSRLPGSFWSTKTLSTLLPFMSMACVMTLLPPDL